MRPPPPSGDNIYRESFAASMRYTKVDSLEKPSRSPHLDAKSASHYATEEEIYSIDSDNEARNQSSSYKSERKHEHIKSAVKKYEEIEDFGKDTSLPANDSPKYASKLSPPTMDSRLAMDGVAQMKQWLMRSCRRSDPVMLCQVERDRSGFGLIQQIYRCYLEVEGSDGSQSQRFLMSAKKMSGKKTSYYLVSLEDHPEDRGSEMLLGKIRGNAVGSQYLLTDHGIAPDKTVTPSMLRREYGVMNFAFDSGGPSQIQAWIPTINLAGIPVVWQPTDDSQSMLQKVKEEVYDKLTGLKNKKPKWDDLHGGHVLNFQGRVNEASVKNFQLCVDDPAYGEEVVLQFGRVGKNSFSMDVRYPLSPFQAFSICVACMDNKIADRKGYELFKKLTSSLDGSSAASGEVQAGHDNDSAVS
jgi:tubby and related proteins